MKKLLPNWLLLLLGLSPIIVMLILASYKRIKSAHAHVTDNAAFTSMITKAFEAQDVLPLIENGVVSGPNEKTRSLLNYIVDLHKTRMTLKASASIYTAVFGLGQSEDHFQTIGQFQITGQTVATYCLLLANNLNDSNDAILEAAYETTAGVKSYYAVLKWIYVEKKWLPVTTNESLVTNTWDTIFANHGNKSELLSQYIDSLTKSKAEFQPKYIAYSVLMGSGDKNKTVVNIVQRKLAGSPVLICCFLDGQNLDSRDEATIMAIFQTERKALSYYAILHWDHTAAKWVPISLEESVAPDISPRILNAR